MMIILFVWPRCQFDNTLYKSCITEGGSLSDSKHNTFFFALTSPYEFKKSSSETKKPKPKNVSVEMNHIYFYMLNVIVRLSLKPEF